MKFTFFEEQMAQRRRLEYPATWVRGGEPNLQQYRREHQNGNQHTCHYYSHEIHKFVCRYIAAHVGRRQFEDSREAFVDNLENFRMGYAETNQGAHRMIDNDFISSYLQRQPVFRGNENGYTREESRQRWIRQVEALRASGGLQSLSILSFYCVICVLYNYDRRIFNGLGVNWQQIENALAE